MILIKANEFPTFLESFDIVSKDRNNIGYSVCKIADEQLVITFRNMHDSDVFYLARVFEYKIINGSSNIVRPEKTHPQKLIKMKFFSKWYWLAGILAIIFFTISTLNRMNQNVENFRKQELMEIIKKHAPADSSHLNKRRYDQLQDIKTYNDTLHHR